MKYKLDIINSLGEYKTYQNQYGKCSVTQVLSQALVHKVRLTPEEYDAHLTDRMEAGESLKFFLLKDGDLTIAAAMGWRRGTVSNGPRIQLQSIAVDFEHRGKGILNILMDSISMKINEMGFKGVDIEVGMNSLIKNGNRYLNLGANPSEVMFSIDTTEKAGNPSHVARLAQERSVGILSNTFNQKARL